MKYTIEFKSEALKFFHKQPKKQQLRIKQAIDNIPNGDIKKMLGLKKQILYKLRVGSYRIIFSLDNNQIIIILINNRGDIYKKF